MNDKIRKAYISAVAQIEEITIGECKKIDKLFADGMITLPERHNMTFDVLEYRAKSLASLDQALKSVPV